MKKKINFDRIANFLLKKIKVSNKKLKKNYFVILVGIPGSGKTTLSKYLSKKYGFCRISTDSIKNYLRKNNYSFEIKDLFKIQRKIFYNLLYKKINIISDSNSDLKKYRNSLKNLSKKFKYIPLIIYLKINIKNAYNRRRHKKRIKKSRVLCNELIRFHKTLEKPRNAIKINANNNKKMVLKQLNDEILRVMR